MNEVEKHYSGQGSAQGHGEAARHGSSAEGGAVAGAKAKVGAAARSATDAARGTYDRATDWSRDNLRTASRTVSDAQRRSAAQIGEGWRGVESFVAENPVMVGVVGLATGLLIGALLPGTRRENSVFGRYADEFRDQGMRYARELAEQGKSYVEESLDGAVRGKSDRDTGDESRAA